MGKMRQFCCEISDSGGMSSHMSDTRNPRHPHSFSRTFHFLIWNLVYCFLFLNVSCDPEHHYPFPTAHVELFSFDRGTLKVIQDKVNVAVTLSQPTRYFELYMFQCNGSYPVQWTYIGEGNPITTADAGRSFKDFYDVKTYAYQSILLMYKLDEFQSGRYICRGMLPEHEKISIYYDVFVPVDGKNVLLTTSEKTVYVPEEKETAYIPCGVSDSTAEIMLYKGNPEGVFKRLEDAKGITFNPRKGFKLKMHSIKEPFGKYMCTAKGNSRRRKVNLYPQGFKMYNEPLNPYYEKYPVQFSYDYKYNRMLCCTGSTYVPKLQWAGCTSILDCQIKSVCFDEDRCEPRIGNAGYDPSKWIDPGPLPQGCSGWKLRDDSNGDMGMFKCTTPGITQYQPYLLNRGNIFLDFETAPPTESIMTLRKMSMGPVYVGRQVEFHCNGTRFYFGYGFRWAFQRGNGDIEFIEDNTVVRDRFFTTAHRRQTILRIPHSDIKAIVCFGPIVNHPTEWRTSSMPIQIEEEPVFVPLKPESPNIYEDLEYHNHDLLEYDFGSHHYEPDHRSPNNHAAGHYKPPHHKHHYHESDHDKPIHQETDHHVPILQETDHHKPIHQESDQYKTIHHETDLHKPHHHEPEHHKPQDHTTDHLKPHNHESDLYGPIHRDRDKYEILYHEPEKHLPESNHQEPHKPGPSQVEKQPSPPPYYDISPYHDSATHLHKDENLESTLPELSYDPHLIDYSRTPGTFTNAQILADKIRDHVKEISPMIDIYHKAPKVNDNEKYKITELKIQQLDHIPAVGISHHGSFENILPPPPQNTQNQITVYTHDYSITKDPEFPSEGKPIVDIIYETPDPYEKEREMQASDLYSKSQKGIILEKTPVQQSIELYKRDPTFPGHESTAVKPGSYFNGGITHTVPEQRHREVQVNSEYEIKGSTVNSFNTNTHSNQYHIAVDTTKREPAFPNNDPYIANQNLKTLNGNPLNIAYSRHPTSPAIPSYAQNPSKISTEYTKIYHKQPTNVPYVEIPQNPSFNLYNKDQSLNTYSTLQGAAPPPTPRQEFSKLKGPSSVDPYNTNVNNYNHNIQPQKDAHHNHVKTYKVLPTSATHYTKGFSSPIPYLSTEVFQRNSLAKTQANNNNMATDAIKAHFSEYYNKLSPTQPPTIYPSLITRNYKFNTGESRITTSNESTANKISAVLQNQFPHHFSKLIPQSPLIRFDNNRKSIPNLSTLKPLGYSTLVKTPTAPEAAKSQASANTFVTIKDNVPSYKQIKQNAGQNQGAAPTVNFNSNGTPKSGAPSPISFDVDFIYPAAPKNEPQTPRSLNDQTPAKVPSSGQLIAQKIMSASSELFNPRPRFQEREKSEENIDSYVLASLYSST